MSEYVDGGAIGGDFPVKRASTVVCPGRNPSDDDSFGDTATCNVDSYHG